MALPKKGERAALVDRLWLKIDCSSSDCWEWIGYKTPGGYGTMKVDGEMRLAHRVSYEVHRGQIPEGVGHHGTCVLHGCDNPACVNPHHLFLGTQLDNILDRNAKDRQHRPRGEKNPSAKLTEDDVAAIRAVKPHWGVNASLAKKYGVAHQHISLIRSRKVWPVNRSV